MYRLLPIVLVLCTLISSANEMNEIILGQVLIDDYGNSELNKVKEFLVEKNYTEAKQQLQLFKNQTLNASHEDMKNAYYELSYLVAKTELTHSKTPSVEIKEDFYEQFDLLSDYYKDAIQDSTGNKIEYAKLLFNYEKHVFNHTFYLQQENEYNRGLVILHQLQEIKNNADDILDEEIRIFYNLASSKNIADKIITMSELCNSIIHNDESKELLIKAYNNYIEKCPNDSTACVYLNLRMRLEGKIDLDILSEMYKKCQDKDKQYYGNLIGLSNLLVLDKRSKDALYFLGQIDDKMIPADRLAEKYYAMARAYELENDIKNAIKYYALVINMDNKYLGARMKIKELTGIEEYNYLDMLDLNVNINNNTIISGNIQDQQVSSSEEIITNNQMNESLDIKDSIIKNSNESIAADITNDKAIAIIIVIITISLSFIFIFRNKSLKRKLFKKL